MVLGSVEAFGTCTMMGCLWYLGHCRSVFGACQFWTSCAASYKIYIDQMGHYHGPTFLLHIV